MAIDAERDRDLGSQQQNVIRDRDLREQLHRTLDAADFFLLLILPCIEERLRIRFISQTAFDDFSSLFRILFANDLDGKSETVKKLRTDVPFFRVHRSNKYKTGRMRPRNAFTLDGIDPHSGRVKKYIDDMVIQQIDLIDIENIAVRICENTCFEGTLAFTDSGFDIQCPDDTVFRRTDWKLDHFHRQHLYFRFCMVVFFMAFITPVCLVIRIIMETASLDAAARRKKVSKSAHSGRLCRPFLALNQYSAQFWIDDIQHKCSFHRILPDDGCEWKCPLSFH